jgi:uncharacterized metal-binding protein YceD (DUF177 family)
VIDAKPEFCRLVPLARLGSGSFRQEIEATADERRSLAERFALLALDSLTATIELRRQGDGTVLLIATLEAAFEQSCVVSLDPVPGSLCDKFSLIYAPTGENEGEVELALQEASFEPLEGDAIDIGEAVAQELSLLLPQFPRLPEAAIDIASPSEAPENPFDALTRLRPPSQG